MIMRKRIAVAAVAASVAFTTSAATAPSFVTDEAVFWLDASTLSQLPGEEVTSWPDVRGEGHPVASTVSGRVNPTMTSIASGDLAGKKAVDFGSLRSDKDMEFDAVQNNVKMVFFVMDIDNAQYACLLGGRDGGSQRFCREKQAAYAANIGQTGNYSIWTNGEKIADPLNTATPSGYNVIVYRCDDTSNLPTVRYLASDRGRDGRVGGKRLCEVIGFTRELTDVERVAVENYLHAKWFEESWSWSDGVSVEALLGLGQVHFDASVASSFHYDSEDPTKVVQWDDLSGNGNHFLAHINPSYNLTQYGTVGRVTDKPVFDSGTAPSGIDLALTTRITDTRSVVMVADIDRTQAAFWLGDSSDYTFHRGSGGQYFYSQSWNWPAPEAGGSPWCNGVAIPSRSSYPDLPGHLSVYVFNMTQNSCWCYLGQDRTQTARNGGKRVAELITFSFELPDSARKRIEDYLFEKWTPSEAYIDAMAAVHVDASSADNFNYTDANITGWKNTGFGADLYWYPKGYVDNSPYDMGYGSYGMTNGVPAFLMGIGGSNIDLAFERLTNIRTVFWAMDIQRVQRAFFLGDPRMTENQGGDYHFHRGGSGEYAAGYNNGFRNGNLACDGTVVNTTGDKPPYGMHVFDLSASQDCTAAAISGDRLCDHRNGGRAISELLILTNDVWGLTRVGVRRRMENKWTRKCGWAGAGDAEWGADKYRVFGADATVPEGGASAKGVGFTSDATLDGDGLAIGTGGFFANEDVTATIDAPISGALGVYGPGTVALANAQALPSLTLGCNATVALKPGTTVTGDIALFGGSKIIIDVSGLALKQESQISIGGDVMLVAGGNFILDYVEISDSRHTFTLSDDGNAILINVAVPVRAVWKGGADATDAANWTCYDEDGDVIANKLPGMYVTNITLEADCNFHGWEDVLCHSGAVIDLMGHTLEVNDLSATMFPDAVITNSVAATTATLDVAVANGATASDSTAVICGNVKFVKSGAGTFIPTRTQDYTGGTVVNNGTLKANKNVEGNQFGAAAPGAAVAEISVATNGVFDIAQKCGWGDYRMTLVGGTLQNSGGGFDDAAGGMFTNIVIAADGSRFNTVGVAPWGVFGNGTGSSGYAPTLLDLGNHDLTINIYWFFKLCNTTIPGDGRIVVTGGPFQTGFDGRAHANGEIAATNVDFRVENQLRLYAPISLHDYEVAYNSLTAVGYNSKAEMKVFGTFTPASHDAFYGCTMMDGSTIDLKNRTEEGKMPFYLTCAMSGDSENCQHKSVTFTPGANVTVDLSAFSANLRTLSNEYVLTWDTPPAASVKFVPDAATKSRGYTFVKDSGGLRLATTGFTIFVR